MRRTRTQGQQQFKAAKPKPPAPPTLRTGIELLARALYSLPALAGQGDWWVLSDEEARTMASQGEAALCSLSSQKLDKATKFFNTVAPWVALTVTVVTVTYIRVQMTSVAYAKARAGVPSGGVRAGTTHAPAGGNGDVPAGSAAAGSGAAKDRVAERLAGAE